MNTDIYTGKLVRLATIDLEKDIECMARWNRDSEYQQLLDSGPSMMWPAGQIKEWMEKNCGSMFIFSIHTLSDDRIIGNLDLSGIDWTARSAWLGIGIGERDLWGKGYGSEATGLLIRFAFEQLNLNRISLNVFEYNQRGYKAYQKLGFVEEGRLRQYMQRGGERYDIIYMGLLREAWEATQQTESLQWEMQHENKNQR
jgi:RimJ/RimL family protein N-acetyltransferase